MPFCKEPKISKEIIESELIIYNLYLKGDTSGTCFLMILIIIIIKKSLIVMIMNC